MKHALSDTDLPAVGVLRRRLQSLAMLDAILMADWELRFFSFDSTWDMEEMMGSMRDGEGNEFYFLFSAARVIGKVYCKTERAIEDSKRTLLARVPAEFSRFLKEPAFDLERATCC